MCGVILLLMFKTYLTLGALARVEMKAAQVEVNRVHRSEALNQIGRVLEKEKYVSLNKLKNTHICKASIIDVQN